MNRIKGFLFVFSGLFVLITVISFLMPSDSIVIRSIVISGEKNDIRKNISDLKQWHYWHPIFTTEGTEMTYCDNPIRYESTCCNVRYKNKAAHVEVLATDSSSVNVLFQQEGENDINNFISITNLKEGGVQAEWKALTKLKWYPWEKFYGIFNDVMTGPGYDAALKSLKEYIESHQ